jgi:hypothetical protein
MDRLPLVERPLTEGAPALSQLELHVEVLLDEGLQEDFDEWVRKRKIEISMIPDPDEQMASMEKLEEEIQEHEEHVAIMKENGMI